MCTGAEFLIPAALSAVGSVVSGREQNSQQKKAYEAKASALAAENARQQQYMAQNQAALNPVLDTYKPDAQKTANDKIATQQSATIQDNLPGVDTNNYAPQSSEAPKVVNSALAKSLSDQVGKAKMQAQALANMNSFGALAQRNSLGAQDASNSIQTTNNFANRSGSINGQEQASAYQNAMAKNSPSGFGDLLQLAGSAGNFNNASGGQLFGGNVRAQGPSLPGQAAPTAFSKYGLFGV